MVQSAVLPPLIRGTWYPMSWEEFLDWAPDEEKSEWVDGKGIAYVSNSPLHIRLAFFFARLLELYVDVFDLGEVFFDKLLVRLPARPSGRMPDIVVIGRADVPGDHDRWFVGRPRLVAEFLSEESVERDLIDKRIEFQEAAFPEYLGVDARPGLDDGFFLRLDGNGKYQPVEPDADGRYHSETIPGFWFRREWFAQNPLPDVEDLMLEIAPEAYEAWIMAKFRARRNRMGNTEGE